ncbi:hypothetical protein JANAI62_31160 [Jannaschia pagri]|uniref:PRC-barrel domain-containing protein n=1 Tax=Jannaschia pagri TaxID=2829797 RepID=A0ABQ4NQ08_9RHOB|nr:MULTISPECIES: PRC-barrel domain-containing protein [unclassified Jannaschia]GIT92647.1 hypothetical protein JANAI61_31050 [Jannaschia sp. AI_61]GIT96493.1 hypothetical protein JANAI62_31160 [Jannaschia sp. AI_62]
MSRLPLTTAALILSGTAALADGHTTAPFSTTSLEYGESYMATTLIGTRIYVTDRELPIDTPQPAGAAAEWDDIGEIGDMIINTQGELEAVVLDIGGFLGIGEREVAIDWSALRPVREDDDPNEWFLTVMMTGDMLENAPELRRTPAD